MIHKDILKSNLEVVNQVIDYFAAEYIDKNRFGKIKESAKKTSKKFNSPNSSTFIDMGFFSNLECTLYIVENGTENPGRVIDETINALLEKLIIYPIDKSISPRLADERFRINGEKAANLYRSNLILNQILGFEYIIDKFKNSVFKIENIDSEGNPSIGTGFLIEENNEKYIVTNKHVLDGHKRINIFDEEHNEIDFQEPFLSETKDIAIFRIQNRIEKIPLQLNIYLEILGEIITIGYPSIPMTKFPYQVYHKGEINSFVADYYDNDLFLISAKTSSGNSGSPIIDDLGTVIGIVTQELFEKNEFYEKGKLPYYAAIPSLEIVKTIKEYRNCG